MRPIVFFSCALATLITVASCGSAPTPPAVKAGAGKHVDPATAGAITGHVSFEGAPPTVSTIRMGVVDPACVQAAGSNQTAGDAAIIAPDGSLGDVFVYVKDALDDYTFDPPAAPITLDQRGCTYAPHVLGVRAGQTIEIVNNDATMHNVHAIPMKNQEFNKGEPQQGSRMTATFTVPEVMVPFRCNVHPWMNAYVGVVAHPFFAVTKADGAFSLQGLPPGTYTVEAWTEKFGTQDHTVTIGDKQTQAISFTFSNTAKK